MKLISRRESLKRITAVATASALPAIISPLGAFADTAPQPAPNMGQDAEIGRIVRETMEQHHAPAISLALARHGQFVFRRAYGLADRATDEHATVDNLFRIASISKPITSVTIFSLVEQGRLHLDDLIFGADGVLKFDYGKEYPERVTKIRLHHLLTHTCGGWSNSGKIDPMFYEPQWDHQRLITWTVHKMPLEYEPGTHYAYSNFGYCVLGRVIEKLTGEPYAVYAHRATLNKCGIEGMRISGNTLAQRAPHEVVYYGQKSGGLDPYNMNVRRMDSHGGWLATPTDLVKFAMHVDGFTTTPNILPENLIKTMTTGTKANARYACGWGVNTVPNWWHDGALPGTQSIMVRTASGLCWAAITNTRVDGLNLDAMMWRVAKAVPEWHA
jgi:CubicO group peptidase (beta-lactamase class C family)